ncbi:nucleotide-binding universal stress UspA family protein [Kribbella sp. VKM Ac-2571]|uniref:universal stress protein n=1 Tax=Kribbella sp. VKM Ac-2571 TaxID=2512222 RepID=UPI00105CBF97|nr:universal stress protein [Kribbella sp. VKM Ac-2571]TDO58770.1 nucleotide-binding universal stress UspA family protein [Kribbella sp. VKM Ac-2571]
MTVKPVIHVGVDGSWRDTGALEWALEESLLRREPLQVVHVIDEKLRHVPGWEADAVDDASMELVNDVQKYLDESPGTLDNEADLMVGQPARKLAQAAADSRMLVVGRRGLGTFKRLLVGSTSEAVVAQATVPVVVVPEYWKPSDHAGPVLVALDEDDDNIAVRAFAVAAAAERGLPIRLVHVWDLPAMYSWDAINVAGVSAEMAETAERRFANVVAAWHEKFPEQVLEVEVRRGHAVDGIVTAAEESDAQLLVLGTRHPTRVASFLLGSVTRGVLHHATCPLAIVPAASTS